MNKKVILTIAGSDSGGGAGIQADLKTMEAFDCFGTSVITAITAQNTLGVQAIYPLIPEQILKQIQSIFDDFEVAAVKIGLLPDRKAAQSIRTFLFELKKNFTRYCDLPIILDPVMVAGSGDKLNTESVREEFLAFLEDKHVILTPNLPETETLFEITLNSEQSIRDLTLNLSGFSAVVYLKGGHGRRLFDDGLCHDFLCFDNRIIEYKHEFIGTQTFHGTGCTLSSAIACAYAHSNDLIQSVETAQQYVRKAISTAPENVGTGNRVLNHKSCI